ncbi:MAG TPA: sulfatase [Sedimentisphaerales bacterium]|nr:sulfatase [Sedimentisphaerales bacterium]
MRRRNFLKTFGMGALSLTFPAVSWPGEAKKPSVLFIAIDDLRGTLGCLGDKIAVTPNMDKLAKQGTVFLSAYCQQAVCNPSRASVITGRRPDTLRVWDLNTHFRKHHPDIITLPQYFKQHGYYAQSFGKILHGQGAPSTDPPSWSAEPVWDQCTKRDQYVLPENRQEDNSGKQAAAECAEVPDEAYIDGKVAAEAVKKIEELAENGKAFFLAVGFRKPHLPCSAPKKYWDMYNRRTFENDDWPALNRPKDGPDIALHNWKELRGYSDIPNIGDVPPEKAAEVRHGYYAAASYTDAQIGRLVDALDKFGLRENTIVCLWSDHGFHLGEHTIWCKTSNYEFDARVPLILSSPQKKKGQVCRRLVELVDMYPTLVELAGLSVPSGLEGTSMVPLLDDPDLSWKKAAFTQFPRPAYYNKSFDVMGYSIRTEQFHYVEWIDVKKNQPVAIELYDHRLDPYELTNLAVKEEHKPTLGKLSRFLEDGWKAALPKRRSQ